MNDMMSKPLKLGDEVLFALPGDVTSTMCVGVITRFTSKKVEVKYTRIDGHRWYSYAKNHKGWTTVGTRLTMSDKLIALQGMNFGPQLQAVRDAS